MLRKRPPVLIATCTAGVLLGMPASAADLTIASALSMSARVPSVEANKSDQRKGRFPEMQKAQHGGTQAPRKIFAYKLPDDTFVQLNAAFTDQRQSRPARGGTERSISAGARATNAPFPDGEGNCFNCRDKSARYIPARHGLVACYRNKLDNAWKAQTYVSGRLSDGSPSWGGGLLLTYAY